MRIIRTEKTNFDKPSFTHSHPVGNGIQKIWRFKNDYGASVVQFKIGGSFSSYSNNKDEYELAVIKFDKHGNYNICYDTKITNDVVGYLSPKKVERLLKRIKLLKRK